MVLFRAEDESDRRVFASARPVFAGVVQVKVHLAGVGVSERLDFEVNHQQAAQPAVEEEEVHAIPLATDAQAALASDEGKVAAEFEQEGFKMPDESIFKIGLGLFVFEAEEFKDERVLDFFLRRDAVGGAWA